MTDFAVARRMMVDGQVRTADVTDLRLIGAMLEVPRERFVPGSRAALAYADLDLPVGDRAEGRRLLKPMVLAKLIHALNLAPSDRVLDVGCATGYGAAIMAHLAGRIVALEQDPVLLQHARAALADAGPAPVEVVAGPLIQGWPAGAPYDAILLEGACEITSEALFSQLAEGGRLACLRPEGPAGRAFLYRKDNGRVSGQPVFDAAGPVLPGFAKAPAFVF